METSLHQQLKAAYAEDDTRTEVRVGRYRIDAVKNDELIEIQHGSLSAIRDKVSRLLPDHRVRVVKPLIARKRLVKCAGKGKPVISRRLSPECGCILDLFDELIYFTRIYPHPNLALEVPLVEIEEWRYPYRGRRRRRRGGHSVEDQKPTRHPEGARISHCGGLSRAFATAFTRSFSHGASRDGDGHYLAGSHRRWPTACDT